MRDGSRAPNFRLAYVSDDGTRYTFPAGGHLNNGPAFLVHLKPNNPLLGMALDGDFRGKIAIIKRRISSYIQICLQESRPSIKLGIYYISQLNLSSSDLHKAEQGSPTYSQPFACPYIRLTV